MPKKVDLSFQRFGLLVVQKEVENRKRYWLCKCDCGNFKEVMSSNLKSGDIQSCGCLRKKTARERATKHKGCGSLEYEIWCSIKQRCFNPNSKAYPNYGGRGITMWADWIEDFQSFIDYIGEKPYKSASIERKNNNGNYEPGNIIWASRYTQARNTRRNVLDIPLVKKIKTMIKNGLSNRQISDLTGINRTTIYNVRVGNTWKDVEIEK